jgi:hypothetical protein
MEVLEIQAIDIDGFRKEIKDIPQDEWELLGLIYGPTELPGMFQIYKDSKNLSRTRLVNYQELWDLKKSYEKETDECLPKQSISALT